MKKMIPYLSLFLGACAPYSSELDCEVGQGMACSSVYKVQKALDRGRIDLELEEEALPQREITSPHPISLKKGPQVWVAPHLDERGNFHEAQMIELKADEKVLR